MISFNLVLSLESTEESFETESQNISGSLKRKIELVDEENENEPPNKIETDFDRYWADHSDETEDNKEQENDLSFLDSPDISDEQVMAEMNDEPPLDYDDYNHDFAMQLIQIQVNIELQEEIKIVAAA